MKKWINMIKKNGKACYDINNIYDFVLKNNYTFWYINYLNILYDIFPDTKNQIMTLCKKYNNRIVFWLKKDNTWKMMQEFYFYNNNLDIPKVHYNEIYNIWEIPKKIKDHFMFSFEYDNLWKINYFDFYNVNWFNYRFDWKSIELRNKYNFFWKKNFNKWYRLLLKYTNNDLFILKYLKLFDVFIVNDGSICISKKKDGIWIYLNRVNFKWLIIFLNKHSYNKIITDFFSNKKYMYLNFDIWVDFEFEKWKYKIVKTSFYWVI